MFLFVTKQKDVCGGDDLFIHLPMYLSPFKGLTEVGQEFKKNTRILK